MTPRDETDSVEVTEDEVSVEPTTELKRAPQGFGEGVTFERVDPVEPLRTVAVPEEAAGEEDEVCEDAPKRGLKSWVQARAKKVMARLYESSADDLESRARRAVTSAYHESADDLEERAVRAMRRAIQDEADRIKEVIEHSVDVKKREVRLSLLVLVVASLVYMALYFLIERGGPES